MGALAGLFLTSLTPIILSLGIIGALAVSMPFEYLLNPKLSKKMFFVELSKFFVNIYKNKSCFSLVIFFFIILISFFFTKHENLRSLGLLFQLKLPLLSVPCAFANIPNITRRQYHLVFAWFLILLLSTSLASLTNYVMQHDYIDWLIINSKPLPIVVNHVRYSLMIVIGILIILHLFTIPDYRNDKRIQLSLTISAILLITFLHISGVRSGILAFYALTSTYIIYIILKFRKYKLAISLFVISVIVGTLCYNFVPSVNEKIANTVKDIKKSPLFNDSANVDMNDANVYSLTGRIYSYKVGMEIFINKPFTGVGIGNLRKETQRHYQLNYPLITNYLLPHNQFIRYLAAFGIIGFIIFLLCFYYPLIKNRYNTLLWGHYLIISISFLVEGTLETQLGISIVLLFLYLFWAYGKKDNIKINS